MAFFKTKAEKDLLRKMERDEQIDLFNEQIEGLKEKRRGYAKIAAEAEMNGDTECYDNAVNSLLDVNDNISLLIRAKSDFDIINLSDSIDDCMFSAMNALDKMANSKAKRPNLRKIQKTQFKLGRHMKETIVGRKAISGAMKRTSPANRTRSEEEKASVRPLIEMERSKLLPSAGNFSVDLAKEIENEKNKII